MRTPFSSHVSLGAAGLALSVALASGCYIVEAPCSAGTETCPCDDGNRCDEGLQCLSQTCVDSATCQPGTQGCRCDSVGGCGDELECRANVCVDPSCAVGTQGCPCGPSESCDGALQCAAGTCAEVSQAGRFTGPGAYTCTVTAPPASLGLPPLYTKYLHCSGVAIVAPEGVADEALSVADETMGFVLDGDAASLAELEARDHYWILRPRELSIEDLPEAWPAEAREAVASYQFALRAGTSVAEVLLCDPREAPIDYFHHFLHIFSFMYAAEGLRHSDATRFTELVRLQAAATTAGRWAETGAINNPPQYFAQLAVAWFEVGGFRHPGQEEPERVVTREAFQAHDPEGYAFAESVLTASFDVPGCRQRLSAVPYVDFSLDCPSTISGRAQTYLQVQIGSQCWMAQNARTDVTEADGVLISEVLPENWSSPSEPSWSLLPSRDPDADGRAYNHAAAPLVCPDGTHLPSFEDALELAWYLAAIEGPDGVVSLLVSQGGEWGIGPFTPTGEVGFDAFPSGGLEPDGNVVDGAFWMWTSTVESPGQVRLVQIYADNVNYIVDPADVGAAASVRCLSD